MMTLAAVGAVSSSAAPAPADHDDALAALSRGEVKSLDEILQALKPFGKETFVSVGLGREEGRWIYEMTLLTADGRYRVLTVDAATATIINQELK